MRSDDEFEKSFANASITRDAARAYLLRALEAHIVKSEEITTSTPKKLNVDHIYPQKPPVDRRWKDHDDWINRVGNLTLLAAGKNKASKNDAFDKNRIVYQSSVLKLNEAIAAETEWGPEQISERQALLAKHAVEVWAIA
ncbi:MAG: HNH endonuclease family protein [Thermoanaerobaculia bacterium]